MKSKNLALLLDFGATRIKSSTVDLETGIFGHFLSRSSTLNVCPMQSETVYSRHQLSATAIRDIFFDLCQHYCTDLSLQINQIFISSEMHGFITLDLKNNVISDYISWKDQRALESQKHLGNQPYFKHIESDCVSFFKNITGMQLRAGLPFVNFIALAKETQLPKKVRIVSIPEWLSICTSKSTKSYLPHAHESMLAGFGLYDIHAHCHSSVLLNYVHEQTGIRLNLNTPTSKICPTNYLKMNGRQIPLYVGVGDHPCAVLGAGTSTAPTTISVNIGTGSQVAAIDFPQQESSLEFRPYFQDQRLTTITHIPAGRILSCCIEFLNQVAAFHSKQSDFNFWLVLQSLSVDEILNSSLSIDLAFFPGAWNYSTGGSIRQITETNFTVKNYLGSVLKALVLQYRDAINKIDPQAQLSEIILGGGVACKLPQLKTLLETTTHRKTQGATAIDETLLGLRTLAWMNTNPSMTLQKASVYFGRSSTIQLDSSEPFRD